MRVRTSQPDEEEDDHEQMIPPNGTGRIPGDSRLYCSKSVPGVQGGRQVIYCQSVKNGMRCSYTCRKDRFIAIWRRSTQNGRRLTDYQKHSCKYQLPLENQDISSFFTRSSTQDQEPSSSATLPMLLARMIGMDNLPLDFSQSPTLWSVLEYAFHQGQESKGRSFHELCPTPCRNTIRSSLIRVAKLERDSAMARYSGPFYVSLAVDEGKTLGTYYLNFVLHNSSNESGELYCHTEIMTGQKSRDYTIAICDGLRECIRYRISISTVVVDQGPGQRKALDPKNHEGVHYFTNIPMIRRIIAIPCICHKLNNAYKKAITECQQLKSIIKSIHRVSRFLKTCTDHSLRSCPQFVSTRWLYDFEIVIFIEKHEDSIRKVLAEEGGPDLDPEFLSIKTGLIILRTLIQQFERSNSKLCDVWPLLEGAMSALLEVARTGSNRCIYASFVRTIKRDIMHTDSCGGLYLLAYLLTPSGHKAWNQRALPPNYGRTKTSVKKFGYKGADSTATPRSEEEISHHISEVLALEDVNGEATEQVSPDPESGDVYNNIIESETESRTVHSRAPVLDTSDDDSYQAGQESDTSDDGLSDDSSVESPDYSEQSVSTQSEGTPEEGRHRSSSLPQRSSVRPNPGTQGIDSVALLNQEEWRTDMSRVRVALDYIAECLEYNSDARRRLRSQFDSYIASVDNALLSQLNVLLGTNLYNWDTLITDKNYRHFADVALRLRPTPASEASAERMISRERIVIVALRNRARSDLIDARITLSSLHPQTRTNTSVFSEVPLSES